MTERLHFQFSLSCIGEGNGNPLQCSCLENPRDEGAWWAAIYGVTQSQTRLKWLSRISLHSSLRKAFLSLLAILWNSAFKWVYLFFSPLPFASLFTAICKASSDNHFAFLFLGVVLITASYTMSLTSVSSSSGTLWIRSNPLNLFLTSIYNCNRCDLGHTWMV